MLLFLCVQDVSGVSDADLPPPLSLDPSTDILPEGTLGETSAMGPCCQDIALKGSVLCLFRFLSLSGCV